MSMAEQFTPRLEPNRADMRAKVYATIGGVEFKNKTAVRAHYSQLINAYDSGHTLEGGDLFFVDDLLKRHRDYDQKFGAGIARFYIARHKTYGTKKVEFERVDGTTDDFSINYCLDPVTAEEYAAMNFRCAARTTVLPDIRAFKNVSGMICEITGVKHARDDLHVDHAPPHVFSSIVSAYLAERGKAPTDFEYQDDSSGLAIFADSSVGDDFRSYHNAQAQLRVIHKTINLSGRTWGI